MYSPMLVRITRVNTCTVLIDRDPGNGAYSPSPSTLTSTLGLAQRDYMLNGGGEQREPVDRLLLAAVGDGQT